ncbi:MAG: lipid A-modifier LpxR family protein [Flavobacteriaceae bacterium]|jgi:hypothetical protein
MLKRLAFLLTIILTNISFSQSYLGLSVDNDLYFGTDRYYSSGIFVGYGKRLPERKKDSLKGAIRTTHWTFGQEITTPHLRLTRDLKKIDYPYNGWLFLGYLQEVFQTPKKGYGFGIEMGMTGAEVSLAKPVQNTYHQLVLGLPSLSWVATQVQALHVNVLATFYESIAWKKQLNWVFYGRGELGTFQTTLLSRFGLQWSTFEGLPFFGQRLENLTSGTAFYVGVQGEYRAHDYAVAGSMFQENGALAVEAVPFKQEWEVGFLFQKKDWRALVLYNNASKDIATQRFSRHQYLNISLIKLF